MEQEPLHRGADQLLLQLLLMHGAMEASQRLALFRTSRNSARLVLQHAKCSVLTLVGSADQDMSANPTAAGQQHHEAMQQQAAMQLAALSPNVRLIMRGRLQAPTESLSLRITSIVLEEVSQLPIQSLLDIYHDKLPRLQELVLKFCDVEDSGADDGRIFSTVRHLEYIGSSEPDESLTILLNHLDMGELQSLKIDTDQVLELVEKLPKLVTLAIDDDDRDGFDDDDVARMLAHPHLQVTGRIRADSRF